MSALISALDKHTPTQTGENGHSEYTWSNDLQELIVQFHFQVVRTNADGVSALSIKLNDILYRLYTKLSEYNNWDKNNNWEESVDEAEQMKLFGLSCICATQRHLCKKHLSILYKMIGQTRDIVKGKGEYTLAYMMIWEWYKFFPSLALYALQTFVLCDVDGQKPYGSWKDIKYFCNCCKVYCNAPVDHPLIQHAIRLMNAQLRADDASVDNNQSLVAKWVPRETSNKFGWLTVELATAYFPEYMDSAKTEVSRKKATSKCCAKYRELYTRLNIRLDTIQIKQCGNNWAAIDHAKTTSITISKQKQALLNVDKNGNVRCDTFDRIQCAANFKAHIENTIKSGGEIKGACIGMENFAQHAIHIVERESDETYDSAVLQMEKDILNSQWRDNAKSTGNLGKIITMADLSGSMEWEGGNAYRCCISLSCRVAEKSILGKRVMTFAGEPKWVNLDHCEHFTDMVGTILQNRHAMSGTNTNFYAALKLILDTIEENKIPACDVEGLVLAIFSDMQIDEGDDNWKSMYAGIEQMYHDAGMRLWGVPFHPPHILFWCLRLGNGFPTLSTQKNASMMSGFSPALLDLFCEKGIDALAQSDSWQILDELLSDERYAPLLIRFSEEMA